MKILLIGLLLSLITIARGQQHYTVIGQIGNYHSPAYVILNYENEGQHVLDTAILDNGKFRFEGSVNDLVQASLHVSPDGKGKFTSPNVTKLFLEQGTIVVNSLDVAANATLVGTTANEIYQQYKDRMNAVMTAQEAGQITQQNRLSIGNRRLEVLRSFIEEHGESLALPVVIDEYLGNRPALAVLESVYGVLPETIKQSEQGKSISYKIYGLKNTGINKVAPDFAQIDTAGKLISLTDFRGKYVLLEFWASWCSPCRAESPNLVRNYQTFKDKNFHIISVSLDNSKEKWINAIQADGLFAWTHVSDLKGWKNAVAQIYDVHGVPTNYLLDPQGKIIALNLRGEALEEKLAEMLK